MFKVNPLCGNIMCNSTFLTLKLFYFQVYCNIVLQPFKTGQVHRGFRQMEEYMQSCGNVWHAFILGWGKSCTLQAACCTMEVPIPLYTKCTQTWHSTNILYNKTQFCPCGPMLKVMWILLIIIAQTSGWGSLTDSISPTNMYALSFICKMTS